MEKACAGLGLADAPTQRDKSTSATQRDKQGAIPVLIVSQQMGLSPVYHTPAIVYHIHARLYRNVIYVGRPLGADKPKLQQRAGGLWSLEDSMLYAAISLRPFEGSILYVVISLWYF